MEFLLLVFGFVLLIKASDFFVDASIKLAHKFHISEVIIGATIVAIGTTLPETTVSATSAFMGHGDIAFGNAIGSIICNTALISGISLFLSQGNVAKKALKLPTIFFFVTYVIYAVNAYAFKHFSRILGILLVLGFVFYTYLICKNNTKEDTSKNKSEKNSAILPILVIIASAIVIAFASKLLIDNGIIIARKFNIPEAVIGLTIIAFGTSLPEFSTAITSLIKGHSNLSIGNIIGANLFNLLNVTGLSCLIRPFDIPDEKMFLGINSTLAIDVPIAFIVMLIFTVPPMKYGKTYKIQGLVLLLIYIVYLIYQFCF